MAGQYDLEWVKIHLSTMWSLVHSRAGFVAQISSLSATLLVVASFGFVESNSCYFKIALTALLILIPLSCIAFLVETGIALKKIILAIQKAVGEEFDPKEARKGVERWLNPGLTYFPYVAVAIIFLVVVYVIFMVWK